MFGALISKKPDNILEIGIGTGYVTKSILFGIRYNKKGKLICVDNWIDWKGKEPDFAEDLRKKGANIIAPINEKDFIKNCPSNSFDFLISDGDHHHSGEWIDETLRIVKNNGFLFFHDTNQKEVFPSLLLIEKRIKKLGLPYYHFTEKSRKEERSDRGWLFVIKKD